MSGVPVQLRPEGDGGRDVPTPPVPGLVVGYYPVAGWPLGTVQAWDGEAWQEPVTVPGFYPQADGQFRWWNGHCWVAEVPVPRAITAAPDPSPRPALPPRLKRAHARRHHRTRPLHSAVTALATITTLAAAGRR